MRVVRYPVNRKKLAEVYNVDREIIYKWLDNIGISGGKTLSPKQILDFVEYYGWPRQDMTLAIPGFKGNDQYPGSIP